MELKRQYVDPFIVSGLCVRTDNAAEKKAETAKIGAVWEQFHQEQLAAVIAGKPTESPAYGVYLNYDSDTSGAFDVIAGVAVITPAPDFQTVKVEAGDYLIFAAEGPLPGAVIETWGKVWTFFNENPQIQRRYATDFEAYTGPESVSIYIGIR